MEAKAALNAMRHKSRQMTCWGRRHLLLTDSQITMGLLTKGRSSRPALNSVARKAAAIQLAFEMRFYLRWVPTKRNHADGPSRGFGIGPAPPEAEERDQRLMAARCADTMPQAFKELPG